MTCGLGFPPPMSDFGSRAGVGSCPRGREGSLNDLMEPEPDEELTIAIRYYEGRASCGECGHPLGANRNPADWVQVVDLAQVKTGWLARGDIAKTFCTTCGMAFETIAHYIPIECAAFPCPNCGSASALTTEVLSITKTESGYNFVAILKCGKCTKQSPFSRLLGALSKITKVKVGPTGVEVEVKS